jgi:hypothetical protein
MHTHRLVRAQFLSSLALIVAGTFVIATTAEAQAPQHDRGGLPPTLHDRGGIPATPPGLDLAAFESEAQAITLTMESGLVSGPDGLPLPFPAQQSVLAALRGLDANGALSDRLATNNSTEAAAKADCLSNTLRDLLAHPDRLEGVAIAFNDFVDASSEEFLSAPPAELLVIRAALSRLLHAAGIDADR